MTRLSAGTETSVGSDGVGAGLEFGVGTGVGFGGGGCGVEVGSGGGVADGVATGSVEHENITATPDQTREEHGQHSHELHRIHEVQTAPPRRESVTQALSRKIQEDLFQGRCVRVADLRL